MRAASRRPSSPHGSPLWSRRRNSSCVTLRQRRLCRTYRSKCLGARTVAMTAEQRRLFEETAAEDEAGLQAQLDALRPPRRHPCPRPSTARPDHRCPPTCAVSNTGTSPKTSIARTRAAGARWCVSVYQNSRIEELLPHRWQVPTDR
jgi:hypothetical protein